MWTLTVEIHEENDKRPDENKIDMDSLGTSVVDILDTPAGSDHIQGHVSPSTATYSQQDTHPRARKG